MIKQIILKLVTLIALTLTPLPQAESFLSPLAEKKPVILAEKQLDLTNRAKNEYTNQIFVDNILLSLRYLGGEEKTREVEWETVYEPFEVAFVLKPDEVFAFHETTYPEFEGPEVTMNSLYSTGEGYKVLAGLAGNGVCHLASLMNWTAQEAGLTVVAKVRHDFALIPEVPRENGTSIRTYDKNQNLYIRNTLDQPVTFDFAVTPEKIDLEIWAS